MRMPEFLVNWSLLKNPVNWIIVVLMLVFAGVALDLVLSYLQTQTPQPSSVGKAA